MVEEPQLAVPADRIRRVRPFGRQRVDGTCEDEHEREDYLVLGPGHRLAAECLLSASDQRRKKTQRARPI